MNQETATLSRTIKRQSYRANLKYGACRTSKESRQLAILAVIKWFQNHHGKNYSFPSQEKILEKLAQVHRVTMSRRTLNRDLDELRDAGALHSIRRHRRHPKLGFELRSTAYYILDRVRSWSAALRRRLELLELLPKTRVPNSAQYRPSLRKENPCPPPGGGTIRGKYAPPGHVPDLIPG